MARPRWLARLRPGNGSDDSEAPGRPADPTAVDPRTDPHPYASTGADADARRDHDDRGGPGDRDDRDDHAGPGFPGPWPPDVDRLLGELLVEVPERGNPAFLDQVLGETGRRLGGRRPFPVGRSPLADDRARDIVRACRDWRSPAAALLELSGVLNELRENTAAAVWFAVCAEAVAYPGLLPLTAVPPLLRTLRELRPDPTPAVVQHLVQSACTPYEAHPVRAGDGLQEAVSRLNQARTAAPGTGPAPLLLRFLDRLAEYCSADPRAAEALRELVGELHRAPDVRDRPAPPARAGASDRSGRSGRPGASGSPDGSGPGAGPGLPGGPAHPLVLQIVLDDATHEGCAGEPRYTFAAFLYDTAELPWRLVCKRESEEPVAQSELARRGSRHLATWRELALAATDAEGLRVEFLLPWSLLGHPADLWPMDEDDYPVGMHFPVVVRSLDRIRSALWHPAWKSKWNALEEAVRAGRGSAADLLGWFSLPDGPTAHPVPAALAAPVPYPAPAAPASHPAPTDRILRLAGRPGDVRRWLNRRPATAVVALSFPYSYRPDELPLPYRAVKDAVREGIPVLVWRRDAGSTAELHELLAQLTADRLPGLAGHVHHRRRAADEDDPADLGHHLTLLWDDPRQTAWLTPTPFTAPGAPAPATPAAAGPAGAPAPGRLPPAQSPPSQSPPSQEGPPAP